MDPLKGIHQNVLNMHEHAAHPLNGLGKKRRGRPKGSKGKKNKIVAHKEEKQDTEEPLKDSSIFVGTTKSGRLTYGQSKKKQEKPKSLKTYRCIKSARQPIIQKGAVIKRPVGRPPKKPPTDKKEAQESPSIDSQAPPVDSIALPPSVENTRQDDELSLSQLFRQSDSDQSSEYVFGHYHKKSKKHKRIKPFKSKHKNVIDPVMLANIEEMATKFSNCNLSIKLPPAESDPELLCLSILGGPDLGTDLSDEYNEDDANCEEATGNKLPESEDDRIFTPVKRQEQQVVSQAAKMIAPRNHQLDALSISERCLYASTKLNDQQERCVRASEHCRPILTAAARKRPPHLQTPPQAGNENTKPEASHGIRKKGMAVAEVFHSSSLSSFGGSRNDSSTDPSVKLSPLQLFCKKTCTSVGTDTCTPEGIRKEVAQLSSASSVDAGVQTAITDEATQQLFVQVGVQAEDCNEEMADSPLSSYHSPDSVEPAQNQDDDRKTDEVNSDVTNDDDVPLNSSSYCAKSLEADQEDSVKENCVEVTDEVNNDVRNIDEVQSDSSSNCTKTLETAQEDSIKENCVEVTDEVNSDVINIDEVQPDSSSNYTKSLEAAALEYEEVPIGRMLRKRRRDYAIDTSMEESRRRPSKRKRSEIDSELSELPPPDGILSENSDYGNYSSPPSSPCKVSHDKLPHKKFLKAGLFSDTFKMSEESDSCEGNSDVGLLPPPIHYGKYFRQQRKNFTLPYDIWREHANSPHRGKKRLPFTSTKYRKMKKNSYIDDKPIDKNYEPQPCGCFKPSNKEELSCVDSDCINRAVFSECNPNICVSQCGNQRIQRLQYKSCLKRFTTDGRGEGVLTTQYIFAGEYLSEYVGEVVSKEEFRRRMTEEYNQDRHHYCLDLHAGMVIDGYRQGSICRFVNHSCEPNCEMQKWNVNGIYRMGLFAIKDVERGQELTYDYNFQSYNLAAQQVCKCGSRQCRGVMGTKRSRRPAGEGGPAKGQKDKRRSDKKVDQAPPGKPMSSKERQFVLKHMIFLIRNIDQVQRKKSSKMSPGQHRAPLSQQDVFQTQYTALKTARSVKTRRLAQAQGDASSWDSTALLAQVFMQIYASVADHQINGSKPAASVLSIPSKKRCQKYHDLIPEPVEFSAVGQKIQTGKFSAVDEFDETCIKMFQNALLFYEKNEENLSLVHDSINIFCDARNEATSQFEEILNTKVSLPAEVDRWIVESRNGWTRATAGERQRFAKEEGGAEKENDLNDSFDDGDGKQKAQAKEGAAVVVNGSGGSEREQEDVTPADEEEIRCRCTFYHEDGLMVQCEMCQKWQHGHCMGVKGDNSAEHYLCELCDPRELSPEIQLLKTSSQSESESEQTLYLTLMSGSVQIHVGDCVYLMKAEDGKRGGEDLVRPLYTEGSTPVDRRECDIMKIEQLWIDKSRKRFARGQHFIRPEETFHEPTRRFYSNELFRIPVSETVSIHSIVGICCVLDPGTYCKGRPKAVDPEDVFICEFRVDRYAKTFNKVPKSKKTVFKPYWFHFYKPRLTPKRTYDPHQVPDAYVKKTVGHSSGKQKSQSGRAVQSGGKSAAETLPAAAAPIDGIVRSLARIKQQSDLSSSSPVVIKQRRLEKLLQNLSFLASCADDDCSTVLDRRKSGRTEGK